jgi:hypothetical protein
MGSSTGHVCKACGTRFGVRSGGGFYFDMLHCDAPGKAQSVGHQALGDVHLRFVKGLGHPMPSLAPRWTVRSSKIIQGEPRSRDEYHAAAEAPLEPCPCGGPFRYDAQP